MINVDNQKILLVEDEVILAMSNKMQLEDYGYRVVTANTGEQAVDVVSADEGINLVLMDIDLGVGIDGTEAAEIILSEHKLPIVFLSSHMEPEIVGRTEKITSYGYVVKSSGITVLDASIKMAFKLFDANLKIEEAVKSDSAVHDVTEKYDIEKELQESEKQYRLLFESTIEGICLHELVYNGDGRAADYRLLDVNPKFEEILNLKKADVTGRLATEVYKTEQAPYLDVYARVAETGIAERFEVFFPPMKKYFMISVFAPSIGRFATVFEDITEQRKLENNLKNSIADLRESQRIAHVGNWRLDIASNEVTWSEELYKMYGFDPAEPPPPYNEHGKIFTPESWKLLTENLSKTVEKGIPYELELETVKIDGSRGWMWVRGEAEFDAEGRIVKIHGAAQDITTRKIAEERAIENNEKYKLLFENSMDGILFTAPDGPIFSANRKACEILQTTEQELIKHGRNSVVDLTDDRLPDALLQRTEKGYFKGELLLKTASGESIPVELNSCIFNDRRGRKRSYISFRELCEQKKKEAELEKALKEKDYLMKELNHRVKNNLMMISSLISLKNASMNGDIDLSDIISQIDAIRIVHEKLLYQREDSTQVDIKDYTQQLLSSVFSLNKKTVFLEKNMDDIRIETGRAISIGLIINEIATNAIKHGFTDSLDARFSVSFKADKTDNQFLLILSNSGKPFPKDVNFDNPETLGLSLISALVVQLEGNIELRRAPSPVFTIRFPMNIER